MTIPDSSEWVLQIFDAQQADKGGPVRRSIADVDKCASREQLLEEVRRRGYHLIGTGEQFVIFCNTGALKIHC